MEGLEVYVGQSQPDAGDEGFKTWALVEIMGHRAVAGRLTVQEIAGVGFFRVDVPAPDGQGWSGSQFYAPKAVYAISPLSEADARQLARQIQIDPFEPRRRRMSAGDRGDWDDEPDF